MVPVSQDALLQSEAFSLSTPIDIQQDTIAKLMDTSKHMPTHSPSASASEHTASPDESNLSERAEGSGPAPISFSPRSDSTSQTGSENDLGYLTESETKFTVALIGFGWYKEKEDKSETSSSSSGSAVQLDAGNFLCRLPWGGNIYVYEFLGSTMLTLPTFAMLVGFAKSVEDLNPVGTEVHTIPFDKNDVLIDKSMFYGLTHIAFRNAAKVQLVRCIARRTAMVHGNSTFRQVCESGPTIADGKSAAFVGPNGFRSILNRDDSPDVIITSQRHRLVHENELKSSAIHSIPLPTDPSVIYDIVEEMGYAYVDGVGRSGILARVRYIPWVLFLLGFILWVLPGVIQWLGGEDRNWASICNQIIGTGSVLLSVVFYITRKLFTHFALRDAMRGEVILLNDGAARFFVPQFVKKLNDVACDPRLPEQLIAKDANSAVRVERDGWLRIGRRIAAKEAHRHWYQVIMDKGVALDLLEAKIYKMKTTNDGNEVILRHQIDGTADEEWTSHFVREDAMIV